MMHSKQMFLHQLDEQLGQAATTTPKQGWVRTLRKALGMTIKQLANRLQVDPSRVVKIESSEPEGAVTLRTMQSVANSLDCVFFYGFMPKSSFESMLEERAYHLAKKQVERVAHTMALEDQAVDKSWIAQQTEKVAKELLSGSWKHLWEE